MEQPWHERLSETDARRRLTQAMGGPAAITRLHESGGITAREAIEVLSDAGSFQEIGELAGKATYDGANLRSFTPADRILGIGKIDGRRVAISADDRTVAEDQADTNAVFKAGYAQKVAVDWQIPLVRIMDDVRGSVLEFERGQRNYLYDEDSAVDALQALERVPVSTVLFGPVVGLRASEAALSHFCVAVRGAAGASLSPQDPKSQTDYSATGVIDNLADTPAEALEQVHRFLSYLPDNAWQVPARTEPTDDRNRRDERLLSIVPERRNRLYNPRLILDSVLDKGSIFEVGTAYGAACITALARVDGYPLGIMAKNPMSKTVAAMDHEAGLKVIRFIQLCELFHLPLAYFVDEPGFMVGIEAQKTGIIRSGARLTLASVESRNPYVTFLVRQVYGVAGTLFTRAHGMYKHYAWLTANWGGMHIEGGTTAAYRRDIENAPDPAARQAEIEAMLWMLSSPFRSLEAFEVDDLIDPRDTRRLLCEFVEAAQPVLATQTGPTSGLAYLP